MTEERVKLTVEELDAIMEDGEMVHTFLSSPFGPLGADWDRDYILKLASENGAELSGPMATRMGHGAFVWRDKEPLFIATKSAQ